MKSRSRPMYALSIRQPWAEFIVNKRIGKDFENRTRMVTPPAKIILVHASKFKSVTYHLNAFWFAVRIVNDIHLFKPIEDHHRGAIVGWMRVGEWFTDHSSKWFDGPCGLEILDAGSFQRPVPWPGRLGFFEITHQAATTNGVQPRDWDMMQEAVYGS